MKTTAKARKRQREWREKNLEYNREWNRAYYHRNKEHLLTLAKIRTAKNRVAWMEKVRAKFGEPKCSRCGYNKYFDVLHFHHVDPSKKDGSVGALMNKRPTIKRVSELDKTVLLCANCHGELHVEENKKPKE